PPKSTPFPYTTLFRSERGGVGHQLARDREGRAGRERDADHRPGSGVVEAVDRRLARGKDLVAVLDDLVGREAAFGAPEVHRAARSEEHTSELQSPYDL